jgi:hypothetical protein
MLIVLFHFVPPFFRTEWLAHFHYGRMDFRPW